MRTAPRSPTRLLSSLTLALALGASQDARAQVNAQNFNPAIGPENVITVEGSRTPGFLKPMANLFVEFAYRPVRLSSINGVDLGNLVETMTTAHVSLGLGLTRWLSMGIDVPIVVYQSSSIAGGGQAAPSSFGLGDLRVVPKVRLRNNETGGFGLALVPQVTFPTGSGPDFRGYSRPDRDVYTLEGRLAADYRFQGGTFIALNAGFRGRLCSGLGLTLSALFARDTAPPLLRRADQPVWRDPATGYLRRQVFMQPDHPVELVRVDMPPGGRVEMPASSYARIRQVVWVLEGEMTLTEGGTRHVLAAGDALGFGPPTDVVFENASTAPAAYVVALARS